ncbi:MAG: LuxR C-terminal-related transcriptional regulator, partial [Chloroflexota bacterium]
VALGNVYSAIENGEKALTHLKPHDHQWRGIVTSLLGLAYWTQGKLSEAYDKMSVGMDHMHQLGNIHFALSSTFGLADVRLGQGRLRDAIAIYKQSLQIAESQPYTVEGLADLYMGLGDLYREQNDLATAKDYFQKSETLGSEAGLPDWRVRFCKFQARMAQTMGSYNEALRWLDEADQLYYPTAVPNIRPIPALRASVHIQQGELHTASIWANQQRLKFDTDVNYLNEFELITLARLGIAHVKTASTEASPNALTHLLERLLESADTDQRVGSMIEILILQAQLQHLLGDESALARLEYALRLAEPEGYVRLFMDEGESIRVLLSEIASRGIQGDYVNKLLATFDTQSVSPQPLIDALSDRELEVLTLIADGLSNREISERLFIALDTVKGHNRLIYQKLQVRRRTEAIVRARDLGLI